MKIYVCLLAVLLSPINLTAQRDKNITACFSSLLVNKVDFTDNTQLKYALYSLWNRDLFESAKHSGSLDALGYGDVNYDDSQAKTLKEMQEHRESIDYNRATALRTAMLDPQASGIIKTCLASLSPKFGVWADVIVEDQQYIDVIIHWNATDGLPLKIRGQSIAGGAVIDDQGNHPFVPIPKDSGLFSRVTDPEIASGATRAIRIQRDNPYSTVSLKFNFAPTISIDEDLPPIPPVPEKLRYETVVVTAKGGVPFIYTYKHNLGANGFWLITDRIQDLTQDPSAVFTSVTCNKLTNGEHTRLTGANPFWQGIDVPGGGVGTREASCSGFTDEFQGSSVGISVRYQETGLVAHKVLWPWVDWNKDFYKPSRPNNQPQPN